MLSFAVLISEEKVIIARCSIEQFTITASMQQFLFERVVFLVRILLYSSVVLFISFVFYAILQ